jgi:hypothetical protein
MANDTYPLELDCPTEIWDKYTHYIIYFYQHSRIVAHYLRLITSLTALILNLAVLVVFSMMKFNTRFDKILSTYSFVCFVASAGFFTTNFVNFNYFTTIGFYLRFFFHSVRHVIIAFVRCLDTFIIYERIQLYKPSLKFLSKTSCTKLTVLFLAVATFTHFHDYIIIMNRYAVIIDVECNATEQIKSYLLFKDKNLQTVCFSILVFEFIFYLVLDLVLNLYLLKILKDFHRYKNCLRISACSMIRNKIVERNNTIIAIALCLITNFLSIALFVEAFFNISIDYYRLELNKLVSNIIVYFIIFKYSKNFFLFYFLNRKFRKCVNKAAEKCCLCSMFFCRK